MKAGFGTASGSEGGGDAGFVPPPVEAIARLFPQLEVLELIGRGGMGAVYKARQPGLDRLVALKILPPRSGNDPDFAERFTREARALASLSHPNIVGVYDFGQVSSAGVSPASAAGVPHAPGAGSPLPITSLHYFLMEFVDGPNLRQVERAGKLSPPQALQIIPQICEALQYAHDEGIVHRDIKPENVLMDKKGRVKIADFGLAKILGREPQDFHLTGAGQVMGTPHYMAPEQVEHPQEVDHRADLYSLGVVFYEMLTGELPLGRFAPPSRKAQVDVRLDEVVMHALENEPARRSQYASQIKSDVETITAHPGQATPPVTPSRGRDYRTRQTLLGLPLVHVAWGIDPATGRPRVAKGIVAVGQSAFGVIAVGFSAWGLFPVGLVAVGFNPVGLFAVGFWAVGLASTGFQAIGLLTLAIWRAVGLVAVAPSPIGLERIVVEKSMVGLLLLLAIVAAWLMDRLIRAIGRQKPGGSLCLAVLLVALGFDCHHSQAATPAVQSRTLANSIRVLSIHFPGSTNVSIFTFLPLGLVTDGPGQAQWSHLIEHLVIRSTVPANSRQANAETMPDYMRLDFYGNAGNWGEGLAHHRRWLEGVPFSAGSLAAEKPRVNHECDFTARNLATHKFAVGAWSQGLRHGQQQVALKGDVQGAGLADVQRWRDEWLVLSNRVLVCVVGGLEAKAVFAEAEKQLGALKPRAASLPAAKAHPRNMDLTWDLEARHLLLTWPIPDCQDDDYAALTAAAQLLNILLVSEPQLTRQTGMVFAGADLATPEGAFFYVSASLRPGTDFETLRRALLAKVGLLSSDPAQISQLPFIILQLSKSLKVVPLPEQVQAQIPAGMDRALVEGNLGLQFAVQDYRYGARREALANQLLNITPAKVQEAVRRYLSETNALACTLRPQP